MDHDDALEFEGTGLIFSATTASEGPFSEEFPTHDASTPDEEPLLQVE
jgi:hypothetical protein